MADERERLETDIKTVTTRLAAQVPSLKRMMRNLATHAAYTRP